MADETMHGVRTVVMLDAVFLLVKPFLEDHGFETVQIPDADAGTWVVVPGPMRFVADEAEPAP